MTPPLRRGLRPQGGRQESYGQERSHVRLASRERLGAGPGTEVVCDPIVHFGGWPPSFSTPCPLRRRQARHLQHGSRLPARQTSRPLTRRSSSPTSGPERRDRHYCRNLPRQGDLPDRRLRPRIGSTWNGKHVRHLRRSRRLQLPGIQAALHRRRRHDRHRQRRAVRQKCARPGGFRESPSIRIH